METNRRDPLAGTKKSTTGRFILSGEVPRSGAPPAARGTQARSMERALQTIRPLCRGLSRVAPQAASRLAQRIFLRPPRHPSPPREEWWATEAERWVLPFGSGSLAAWRWGWGGEKVLLVHGWGGRGLQLGAFAAPLVEAGYQVVAYDAPGHGQSYGERSSLPEKAAAVAAMVHHLGGVKAIIAHSAGAAAVTAALGSPGTPLPVERLVYLAPSVDMIGVTRRFAEMVGFSQPVVDRMREGIEERYGVSFRELAGEKIAPRLDHPLLVIHDRGDREISLGEASRLVQSWNGARLLATKGLGHYRLLRDDAVVARSVSFAAARGSDTETPV